MKSLKERTEIQQACLDGAEIEYTQKGSVWQKAEMPAFNWYEKDYRVKPKPMTEYIAYYPNGCKEIVVDGTVMKCAGVVRKFIEEVE